MKDAATLLTCRNCKHFVRHYIRYKRGNYCAIDFGHCVYPRIKDRSIDTPACVHFKARETETTAEA